MTMGRSTEARRLLRLRTAAAAAALLMSAPSYAIVADAAQALSDADQACVACHAADGLTKKLANGDTISLAIDPAAFARSVHAPLGCTGCHSQVALPAHPGNAKTARSARDYEITQVNACRACHERTFKIYEGSLHAARLREGNAAAPTCGGCHSPHKVMRASAAQSPDRACFACHDDVTRQHSAWLPNASQHLAAIACSACHAPDALRQVDLRLYAGTEPLRDADGSLQFEKRARAADGDHDGLDAGEFRALLADLRRSSVDISVRGYMTLRNPAEAHELPGKPTALKACVDCHNEDSAPFRKVTVSVLDAEGAPLRYDARHEVLSSAMSAESLRGFYAVGGTRVKLLDVLLALALGAGIAVPALHLLVRRLTARKAKDSGERS